MPTFSDLSVQTELAMYCIILFGDTRLGKIDTPIFLKFADSNVAFGRPSRRSLGHVGPYYMIVAKNHRQLANILFVNECLWLHKILNMLKLPKIRQL